MKTVIERKYTQDELYVMTELQLLSQRILNMPLTPDAKHKKVLAEARKEAARHLVGLGYSYRTVASVIGVKSPQSISQYLEPKPEKGGLER